MGIILRENKENTDYTFKRFLDVMAKGLQTVSDNALAFIQQKKYELQFNSQSINLERYLNDYWDVGNRGIWIQNTADIIFQYVYNDAEAEAPFYMYNKSEDEDNPAFYNSTETFTNYDFIIHVPSAVASGYDLNEFNSTVQKYIFSEKRYLINVY